MNWKQLFPFIQLPSRWPSGVTDNHQEQLKKIAKRRKFVGLLNCLESNIATKLLCAPESLLISIMFCSYILMLNLLKTDSRDPGRLHVSTIALLVIKEKLQFRKARRK